MSVVLAPEPLPPPTASGAARDARDARVSPAGVRGRLAALVRARPVAAAGTLLVAAGALWPAAPLETAAGAAAKGVTLEVPLAYALFSPFARLADLLCLLSTAQHVALAVTLLAAAAAWAVARRCAGAGALRTCARAGGACALALAAFVALLAGAVFAPRPMAAIAAADRDEVRVDFHTHTNASHDVPAWFTPERRRAWHAAAGFDLAYVSDHKGVRGALAAARANPARAGGGLVVRPAIESWWNGIHVVVLGDAAADPALLADEQADRALAALAASGRRAGAPAPVGFAAIPDDVLRALTPAARDSAPWLRGVEVADGAPRALAQRDREGAAIAARAAALGLVPLAATNHHGWGRTAVAWNLVRVPGWRAMTPAALGDRVEDVLRRGDAGAVRVVARARPAAPAAGARRALALAATLPAVAWQAAGELPAGERLAWLGWLWAPAAAAAGAGRVRRSRPARRAPGR